MICGIYLIDSLGIGPGSIAQRFVCLTLGPSGSENPGLNSAGRAGPFFTRHKNLEMLGDEAIGSV